MDRQMCEWYRDAGLPQDKPGYFTRFWPAPDVPQCYNDPHAWNGRPLLPTEAAIPDIPGLLAFARVKLPEYQCSLQAEEREIDGKMIFGYEASVECFMHGWEHFDPDPRTALAMAIRAAVEAM